MSLHHRSQARDWLATRGTPSIRYALVGAFGAIAIVFTIGLVASHTFVARIRVAAAEITENSSPTISTLSAMRGVIRRLQVATIDHIEACDALGCTKRPDRVFALEDELRATWHRYRLLPAFPGEAELWPRVDADMERVAQGMALTLEAARAGRREEALSRLHEQLTPAFDWLDAGVERIQDSDHAGGLAAAARIEALARFATVGHLTVGLLTFVLTVAAGFLAVGLVRRYERSLRDRADDLEQFAARVAHDLKGPLTSTASSLRDAIMVSSSGPGRDALDRGQRGLQRLRRLVDDLLEFARAGAHDPRKVAAEVHEVVEEAVGDLREVAAEHGVVVRIEALARERVACSPGVLASIVQNLLRNAISHMGDSEIRVVRVRAPTTSVGQRVRIEVEDSGPGIPDGLGNGVFEPFARDQEPGSGRGLELATVKRFVSAHGGRIGFQPITGRGTLFWLEMPRHGPRERGRELGRQRERERSTLLRA